MKVPSRRRIAVVISGVWPDKKNGYGMAVASTLRSYSGFFECTYLFGPKEDPFTVCDSLLRQRVKYVPVKFSNKSRVYRFLKSLLSSAPAITAMYRSGSKDVLRELELIRERGDRADSLTVIFEDTPSLVLLAGIRKRFPACTTILRSHNVLVNGFSGMSAAGPLLSRLAWKIENIKIKCFEKKAIEKVDALWAISDFDANEYRRLFNKSVDGILGITFDSRMYEGGGGGDSHNIIFLGSADLRKGMGLHKFVRDCWPLVKARVGQAQLILGGKGTERFHDPDNGIVGVGFVRDENNFLASGRIFINPQLVGSGVKLKSIVAMLAGKIVVSTPNGVEGVTGQSGTHFFVEDNWRSMAERLIELIERPESLEKVSVAARQLAIRTYDVAYCNKIEVRLLNDAIEAKYSRGRE